MPALEALVCGSPRRIAPGDTIAIVGLATTWAIPSATRPGQHSQAFTAYLQPPNVQKPTTWNEFIRTHMDVLVATDFFTG